MYTTPIYGYEDNRENFKKGNNSNFLKVVSFIAVVLRAISCSSSAPNPVISTQYTDSKIETLIQSFTPNRDIQPTATQLQRFQRDFPNAREVDWESNNQIYEVEFEVNHRDFTAFYDNEGNLLMFKQEILNSELPKIVKAVAETQFPNFRLESDTYKIVKGNVSAIYEQRIHYNSVSIGVIRLYLA